MVSRWNPRAWKGNALSPDFFFSVAYFTNIFLFCFPIGKTFNFLQFCWLRLFTLGSSGKLHIRPEFFLFLCSEDDMLNAIKTAVCSFPFFIGVLCVIFFLDNFNANYFLTSSWIVSKNSHNAAIFRYDLSYGIKTNR